MSNAEDNINTHNDNVGIAFVVTIGAGISTILGASVVFIPTLVKLANQKVLASSMGLSAGVMIYVSFVEIMVKSRDRFRRAGHGNAACHVYAACCFFGGIFVMSGLHALAGWLTGGHHHHHHHHHHRDDESHKRSRKSRTRDNSSHDLAHDDDDESSSCGYSFDIDDDDSTPCHHHPNKPTNNVEKVHQHVADQAEACEKGQGVKKTCQDDDELTLNSRGSPDEEHGDEDLSETGKKKLLMVLPTTRFIIPTSILLN